MHKTVTPSPDGLCPPPDGPCPSTDGPWNRAQNKFWNTNFLHKTKLVVRLPEGRMTEGNPRKNHKTSQVQTT